MTILEILLSIILLFVLICFFATYLIYKFRKKYTRERFAFFSVGILLSSLPTIALPMVTSQSIINVLISR